MNPFCVARGRIAKISRARAPLIDGATLRPPGHSPSGIARAIRFEMMKEELKAENVHRASTLTLLRARARNIRATYERLWRCWSGNPIKPFVFDSLEGDGDEASRISKLREYVDAHVRVVEDLRAKIERDEEANRRWKKANRGSGRLARMLRERDAAVIAELGRRQHEPDTTVSASANVTATTEPGPSARALYPATFADDVARIQREMDAEEAGVKKPSRGDRIAASRTCAYEKGDMDTVKRMDQLVEKRQATRRAARRRAKARKAELRNYIQGLERTRASDPPSDHERS